MDHNPLQLVGKPVESMGADRLRCREPGYAQHRLPRTDHELLPAGARYPVHPLFDAIDELGPDITFQTATSARIGDVGAAIAEAISLGANAVELPGPYSLSQATSDARALMANPEAPN